MLGSCAAEQPFKNFGLNEKAACCITKFGARIRICIVDPWPLACVRYLLLNKGGPDLARKFQFYRNKFRRELELCGATKNNTGGNLRIRGTGKIQI